ncbi:PREDICTED: vesicle transport protein USE1 isoform X1 [Gekko japonicus]|uniref:Vesicle transport protein USE1 n=1 Tax=Gekko japonicus TaxID=146911 RepID=A0ABM1K1Y4_GEKJA|nr:PREDICTED: vesicle transport protein USE1 isoform X1 [Gekko japonicus]
MALTSSLGSMPVPRAELKLVRLLSRCEVLAADRRSAGEWRLEKYVAALEEMLLELKKHSSKPAPEVLNEYSRKVDFLKGMLETEKLSSSSEKALANQFLAPGRIPTTTKERVPATQTVHLQTKARYAGEMRSELLGTDFSCITGLEETSLRKRAGFLPDEKQSAADLDAVLQHHHSIQEKLAEEMLHLARNLKNNTLVAQNVIKQDNQTLSHSLKLADQNFEKLKDESDRLEQHAKKSVNWLLWLMLIVVCFIFISMILFIRIFPKLR